MTGKAASLRSADNVAAWNAGIVGVLGLLSLSEIHRGWSVADIERLIVPPLALDQAVILTSGVHVVAYASYALLTEEAEAGYVNGTRKIQPTDWNAGDRLWLVDVIAPYGHARHLLRHLRSFGKAKGLSDREIRFRRSYSDTRPRRYARART